MTIILPITARRAKELIEKSKGKFFHIVYKKKDGSIREMTARIHAKGGVTGRGLSFDPIAKGLLPVYDLKAGFRFVNLREVISFKMGGSEILNKKFQR